jgi:hypothetical protein
MDFQQTSNDDLNVQITRFGPLFRQLA